MTDLNATIANLTRAELEHLLLTACIRLAFVRSTDAAVELRRLSEAFSHDDYRREGS